MMRRLATIFALIGLLACAALAEDRFPPPEFRSGYTVPAQQTLPGRAIAWQYVDVAALVGAMGLAAYLVHKKRSRGGIFALTIASIIYFGFWRKGCVCSIGAIQNVAQAACNGGYALPWSVVAFFLLPLIFTLFVGRVFCAGVCPLGAIQDAVLWRPVQLPYWVESAVGLFAYAYLGVAVLFAAMGSDYIICQYDPFVAFFRLSGSAHMLFLGAVFLLAGMFIGRLYCRLICPYGVLLRLLSPLASRRVSITPKQCVDCRLCEQSCPFGAIRPPTPATLPPVTPVDRRWMALSILLVVLLPAMLAWLGHRAGPVVARVDPLVKLAERVQQSGQGIAPTSLTTKNLLDAFNKTGQSPDELFAQAAEVQKRFATGTAWLGVWMGLVISLKLLAHTLRRRRADYTADAGTCVACARCFKHCPVDAQGQVDRSVIPV